MSTLPIRLPEDAADHLKSLAKARGLSVNKLVERRTYEAIASFDTETRFRTMATGADISAALAILGRLDAAETVRSGNSCEYWITLLGDIWFEVEGFGDGRCQTVTWTQ